MSTETPVKDDPNVTSLTLPTSSFNITLKTGEILESTLLDLNYLTLAAIQDISEAPTKTKMLAVATAINTEHNCEVSWGEAAYIFENVQEQLQKLKKNS